MTEAEHVRILQFFLSLGLLWFAYSFMYQKTRRSVFREDLFTIRDNLFDYMWQHDLSYDLLAYRLMRNLLNSTIRSAHYLKPVLVLSLTAYLRRHPTRHTLEEAIGEIEDPEVRTHFQEVKIQFCSRLRRYVFLEGLQWLVFKPVFLLKDK